MSLSKNEGSILDLEAARAAMIDSQVRPSDVTDRRLIAAMAETPRERFVPEDRIVAAYADRDVETLPGRWLAAARDFSRMINALEITEDDRVLDIAPGTGYSSTVLSRLAGSIIALEEESAAETLKTALAGLENVEVVVGALKLGASGAGPFDVIVVNGAVEDVPQSWLEQLADNGRLAVAVLENGVRRLRIYVRSGGKTSWRTPFETGMPLLPGFEKVSAFRL